MSQNARPSPPSVVVVGSSIVDFCVRVPRLPQRGETVLASGFSRSLGGKGANQAIALRRLGAEVAIVTSLGDDAAGGEFLRCFREEGIEVGFVHTEPSAPTGIAFPMVLADGGNAIVAAPAASLRLPVAVVEAAGERIGRAAALLLQLEIPPPAAEAAMALARAAGVSVFLNPAPFVSEAPRLASLADILIPNQLEAEALTGKPIPTPEAALGAAEQLRTLGPAVVIVTLGEQGAVLSGPGFEGILPACPVEAVDTTGAGDAFCAGLVAARCRGIDWPAAVAFANACGALACRGEGAIPWLPTGAEVRAFQAGERH